MRSVLTTISLKEGVQVVLRCTLSVYGIAKRKGFKVDANPSDDEALAMYVKLAYCAALNDWEIKAWDNPEIGAFPYTLADFDTWAWSNFKDFQAFIAFFIEAMTGKSMETIAGEKVKKKKRKGPIGWIMALLKHSS